MSSLSITRKQRNLPTALKSDYLAQAMKQVVGETEIEIDADANVSLSPDGAWVAAWIWVDKEAIGPKNSKDDCR